MHNQIIPSQLQNSSDSLIQNVFSKNVKTKSLTELYDNNKINNQRIVFDRFFIQEQQINNRTSSRSLLLSLGALPGTVVAETVFRTTETIAAATTGPKTATVSGTAGGAISGTVSPIKSGTASGRSGTLSSFPSISPLISLPHLKQQQKQQPKQNTLNYLSAQKQPKLMLSPLSPNSLNSETFSNYHSSPHYRGGCTCCICRNSNKQDFVKCKNWLFTDF